MKLLQLSDIHGVQTFAARNIFANQTINFRGRSFLRQTRMNHHGFGARLGRKIAFMADTGDLAVQAQREQNLRRRRKQRNNAHKNATLPQFKTLGVSKSVYGSSVSLLVKKIPTAYLIERTERLRPTGDDFFRWHAVFDLLNRVGIPHEPHKFVRVKLFRIELLQDLRDFQTQAHRTRRKTIGNQNRHAAAALPAMGAADGNEGFRSKPQAGKMALIQRSSDLIAVHPRGAEHLERRLRPAAHRNAGVLQNLNPGIENRTLGRTQRRRRRNPLHSRAFKKIVAMPVSNGDDMQVGANVIFRVEELRKLPDG